MGCVLPRQDSRALEVQKLRGLTNRSDVALEVKTLGMWHSSSQPILPANYILVIDNLSGSTTLIGGSEAGEDIDRRLFNRQVLEGRVLEESYPLGKN